MKSKLVDIMIIGILALTVVLIPETKDAVMYVWESADRPLVVIDAGHGGIDGGAEGSDGTLEKDINLAIALKLRDFLEKEGIKVIMTRTEDEGLYADDQQGAIRSLKTSDMYARKQIMDDSEADLIVSIHLNSFTQDTTVKGAQVFYPSEGDSLIVENSKRAAEIIQEEFNENVNTDKKRSELGKNDVFILQNISRPIVIAECGFLSNEEDLNDLKNKKHQEKISKSLEASICKYLRQNGNKTQ